MVHTATRAAYLQSEVDWQTFHIATCQRTLDDPHATPAALDWAREFAADCEQYRTTCQGELDQLTAATRPTEA